MTQLIRSVDLSSALYVVATPIGNLRDITLRALDTLSAVDVIYAEDTRQTRRLLDAYGLKTTLRTYHDHNGAQMRPLILKALEDGEAIALVSDAGTPLISDPGFKLVREVCEAGHKIIPLPGPSAAIAALSVAGLPTDVFTFAGFMPPKSGQRKEKLKAFLGQKTTLILYETGPRLGDTLKDVADVFGAECDVVIARELTKLFEEVRRETAQSAAERLSKDGPPKGEIVLLISLSGTEGDGAAEMDVETFLSERLADLGAKGAANEAAKKFGRSKRELYAKAVALQSKSQSEDG